MVCGLDNEPHPEKQVQSQVKPKESSTQFGEFGGEGVEVYFLEFTLRVVSLAEQTYLSLDEVVHAGADSKQRDHHIALNRPLGVCVASAVLVDRVDHRDDHYEIV